MKKIVDENGEIVEVPEANEIAERKLFELGVIDDETFRFLKSYREMCEEYDNFRFVLEKAMRENNIAKWQTEDFTASIPVDKNTGELKTENVRVAFDEERFKQEHPDLWEAYRKLVTTKVSLRINFKKEG